MAEDAKQEIIGETEVVVGRSTEIVVSNPEEYALASEILANVAALKKRIVALLGKAKAEEHERYGKAEAFASRAAEVSIPASTVESTVPSTVRLTSGGAVTAKKDIEVTVVDKAALLTALLCTPDRPEPSPLSVVMINEGALKAFIKKRGLKRSTA